MGSCYLPFHLTIVLCLGRLDAWDMVLVDDQACLSSICREDLRVDPIVLELYRRVRANSNDRRQQDRITCLIRYMPAVKASTEPDLHDDLLSDLHSSFSLHDICQHDSGDNAESILLERNTKYCTMICKCTMILYLG